MFADYNEEAYENALIELFQNMGWEHVYGPDIDRDFHSPLYDSVLEDSIRRLNPSAAPAAIDEALLKLRHFENAELKKKNAVFSCSICSFHSWTSYHLLTISRQRCRFSGVTISVLKSGWSCSKRLQWLRFACSFLPCSSVSSSTV